MEKESPHNGSSEPKDPFNALGYLLDHETTECPNCSYDMELMTVYKEDGAIDYKSFYCWNCDYKVDSDYAPSDVED